MDLTQHWLGWLCLAIFTIAYLGVIAEELLGLRKSIPMLVAAALIWIVLGWAGGERVEPDLEHALLEFSELFLFLLAAMTYVNTLEDRGVFRALRDWLLHRRFTLRGLFWVTGALAFVISPIADNLTTALLMGTVVVAVGQSRPGFVTAGCVNVVVAANSGGVFSPFGDITTLMVWQAGKVTFGEFFALFLPALATWLIPAALMARTIPPAPPVRPAEEETSQLLPGAYAVLALFLFTIALSVVMHNTLHLPPVVGMMGGLGLLKLYGYHLDRRLESGECGPENAPCSVVDDASDVAMSVDPRLNVFNMLEKAEWDTLMFFYGVILCVGGLGTAGYLAAASSLSFGSLGATWTAVLVGVVSAIVDNIPVMVAVLRMNPELSHGHWLLVTLTAGVGGSLLSVGSAAGVALMGQARGIYTFMAHLRWAPAIALGYAAGIGVHLWVNAGHF